MRLIVVALIAMGLREPHQVKPVPGPFFTVVPGLEQPVDQVLPRVGRLVLLERLDLGGGRRQSNQVKIGSADQGLLTRRRRGTEPLLLQLRENERVDRTLNPAAVLDRRDHGLRYLFPSPPGTILCCNSEGRLFHRLTRGRPLPWSPGKPHLHPAGEQIDLGLGKLPLRRHLVLVILIGNHLENQAVIRIFKMNGGTNDSTLQHAGA